ncbi:hypothetical protein FGO68_gene12207 [Halteria grandinella]|uniref:Uncharacterized protein n=1 Tax=Halteria grandinella TaxID=5974 RepID=A0A8J8NDQ9_HALGN|nr:hypothetical protein FGO68_gene12207 [Halteria grandinella]
MSGDASARRDPLHKPSCLRTLSRAALFSLIVQLLSFPSLLIIYYQRDLLHKYKALLLYNLNFAQYFQKHGGQNAETTGRA